jgi:hypothetical protein
VTPVTGLGGSTVTAPGDEDPEPPSPHAVTIMIIEIASGAIASFARKDAIYSIRAFF